MLSNVTASLKSGKLLKYFGNADCHAVTDIGDETMKFMTVDGHEKVKKYLEDMEQTLGENGMPADRILISAAYAAEHCPENNHSHGYANPMNGSVTQ